MKIPTDLFKLSKSTIQDISNKSKQKKDISEAGKDSQYIAEEVMSIKPESPHIEISRQESPSSLRGASKSPESISVVSLDFDNGINDTTKKGTKGRDEIEILDIVAFAVNTKVGGNVARIISKLK